MEKTIQIVKEIRDLETNELVGYLVDGTKSVPLAESNKDFREVQEWIAEGNTPEPAYTDEELAEQEATRLAQEAEKARDTAMLAGAEYSGYLISFTKEDGDGLLQVKAAFDFGLTSTIVHFKNGTKMPLTATEFLEFASWFVTERNKFFAEV